MLANFLNVAKNKYTLMLFFMLLLSNVNFESYSATPVKSGIVETVVDEFQTEDEPKNESKADKKKDKDKIQINTNFYLSLLIDLVTVLAIIIFIYFPNYKKMDNTFTFLMFNVVIFLLTFVLNKVKISMGAAFGLFAVFSMLRYRTAGINIKDMTYLFIFIAIGLVSGIQLEFYELGILAAIIFISTFVLDTKIFLKKECSNILRYERIEMIKPEHREDLINELRERTGLDIHRVNINEIDFLRDTAMITYYYYEED